MSWGDEVPDEFPGLSVGQLDDESVTVAVQDTPEYQDTSEGRALVIPVSYVDGPDGMKRMDGDTAEKGEVYRIFTSSSRLQRAIAELAMGIAGVDSPDALAGDELNGQTLKITGHGDPSSFNRSYEVELVNGADEA